MAVDALGAGVETSRDMRSGQSVLAQTCSARVTAGPLRPGCAWADTAAAWAQGRLTELIGVCVGQKSSHPFP